MNGQIATALAGGIFIFSFGGLSFGQTDKVTPDIPTHSFFVQEPAPPAPSVRRPTADVDASPIVEATPEPKPNLVLPVVAPVADASPVNPSIDAKNFYAILRQIDVEGKRAVAQGGWEITKLQVGAHLVAQQEGKNCFLVVTSVQGNLVQLDGGRCPFFDRLIVGQVLEPSLFVAPSWEQPYERPHQEHFSVDPRDVKADDRLRLAVSLYYGFGSSLDSNNLSYVQGGNAATCGSGSLTMNSAPGVALEMYQSPDSGFGWSAGANYDFQRNVSGLNAYANGTYIGGSFNNPEPTLNLLTIYGNFIFRADKFYFPVGLNYTFPSFSGGANSFGNTSIGGGGGIQIAAGYLISDHFATELWIQSLSLDGNTITPYGTITYNGLNFTNTQLRLRFSF
jgi:hypothetical protein